MKTALHPTTKPNARPRYRPEWEDLPPMKKAVVEGEMVIVTLKDKRVVQFPISWSEPLVKATPHLREKVRVSPLFLFWDELDEVIGIENILYGNKLYLA